MMKTALASDDEKGICLEHDMQRPHVCILLRGHTGRHRCVCGHIWYAPYGEEEEDYV